MEIELHDQPDEVSEPNPEPNPEVGENDHHREDGRRREVSRSRTDRRSRSRAIQKRSRTDRRSRSRAIQKSRSGANKRARSTSSSSSSSSSESSSDDEAQWKAECDVAWVDLKTQADYIDKLLQDDNRNAVASAREEIKEIEALKKKYLRCSDKLLKSKQCARERDVRVRHQAKRTKFMYLFKKSRDRLLSCTAGTDLESLNSTATSERPTSERSGNLRNLRLPKVEIPAFNGSGNWVAFKGLFTSLIHNNQDLDNDTRHHYLRALLSGDALVLIQNLPLTAENYEAAWNTITRYYDDPFRQIAEHFNSLHRCPTSTRGSPTLKELIILFRQHVAGLQTIMENNTNIDGLGQCMIFWFLSKCDKGSRNEWERELSRRKKFQTFEEFVEFMESRCAAYDRASLNEERSAPKPPTKRGIAAVASSDSRAKKYCAYCRKTNHYIPACKVFRELSAEGRLEYAKRRRLCISCLRPNCRPSRCSKIPCKTCRKPHNTLFHVDAARSSPGTSKTGESTPKITNINVTKNNTVPCNGAIGKNSKGNTLLPFTVVTATYLYENPKGCSFTLSAEASQVLLSTALVEISTAATRVQVRALLDQGSQFNFISNSLVNQLGLQTEVTAYSISGISGKLSKINEQVRLEISAINSNFRIRIHCLVLNKITEFLPAQFFSIENWNIPPHLSLADTTFNIPGNIDLLLGGEIFWEVLGTRRFRLGHGLPNLRDSKLGWLVAGSLKLTNVNGEHCLLVTDQGKDELLTSLERFWHFESFPNEHIPAAELEAERIFLNSTIRDGLGRFVVRLPFKRPVEMLGESKNQAMNRFLALEKRFRQNPNFKKQYMESMNDFINQGHMREVINADDAAHSYYIPHHAVIKETSTSTKLRTVFDASMKTSTGVSLNDILLVGPVVQKDLISILLRFRLRQWVFVADIKQMYRQIRISDDNVTFQRVFWRPSEKEEIKTYEIPVLLFGTASAPFLATRCLKALADEINDRSSLTKAALEHDFYVDDVLSGADMLTAALDLQANLIKTLKGAGFELSKWCTNHPDLEKHLSPEQIETQFPLQSDDSKTVKTLGLLWLPIDDKFKIWLHLSQPERATTKRQILSVIASIFDPMGFIGPVTVKAKLIMQAIWKIQKDKKTLNWDDDITGELKMRWIEFARQLIELNNISIDRYSFTSNYNSFEIHGFCDASEKAIGAVIYLRSLSNTIVRVSLFCAKSKVNPATKMTIPRLELCGALLLSELVSKVKNVIALSHQPSVIRLWCDSTVALSWINSNAQRWQPYVANRVQKIKELTSDCLWDHVGTNTNPADILSRGCLPNDLKGCEIWWKGPNWLYNSNEPWTREIKFQADNKALPELRKTQPVALSIAKTENTVFHRMSSYQSLIRVVAYIGRFARNSLPYIPRTYGELKMFEISAATTTLIKLAQEEYFGKEIKLLRRNPQAEIKGPLAALTPFLDERGILRVGGRLENANISYEQRHPILLSPHHKLTKLIVHYLHHAYEHAGPLLLRSVIRRQYWILRIHMAINNCLLHCITCIRHKAETKTQIMADLPKNRVIPCRAFTFVGVDFAGPLKLIERRARGKHKIEHKVYIALFICFTTKAIHLELVSDLTAESFIASLDRFTGRRGLPIEIYSDNGGNFIGGRNELEKERIRFNKEHTGDIVKFATFEGITWHFSPPYAPHFGGLWEAGVKSVKAHLNKILGAEGVKMTFEEYTTILIRIEACLNSRPLVPESSNPNDVNALTPGHFLTFGPTKSLPNPNLVEIPENRLKYWDRVKRLQQMFWRRWSSEYLNTLHQRSKWRVKKDDLSVNSLVIIKEDNMPPSRWAMGRIIQLHTGRDNHARVATLRTTNGTVTRAITRLIPLPASDEYSD